MDPTVDCSRGGAGLYEQSMCKDKTLAELRQKLEERLPLSAVEDFEMSAKRICEMAYEPSKTVLIYPLVIRNCLQQLIEMALEAVEQGTNPFP